MLARIETLVAIGKQLRGQDEDIAREPLPRRWVDLIHHLNEQEQDDHRTLKLRRSRASGRRK